MSHTKKAIFFDLDGTLLNTAPDLVRATNLTAGEYGYPGGDFDTIRSQISAGARAMLRTVLPERLIEEAREVLLSEHFHAQTQGTHFFYGLEDCLKQLQDDGVVWGIMTNKFRHLSEIVLERLAPWWDRKNLYCSDDFSKPKPHPMPLHTIASEHGLNGSNCYYVGDHRKDIECAREAGWKSIGVSYGYHDDDPNDWSSTLLFHDSRDLCSWIQRNLFPNTRNTGTA